MTLLLPSTKKIAELFNDFSHEEGKTTFCEGDIIAFCNYLYSVLSVLEDYDIPPIDTIETIDNLTNAIEDGAIGMYTLESMGIVEYRQIMEKEEELPLNELVSLFNAVCNENNSDCDLQECVKLVNGKIIHQYYYMGYVLTH